MFRLEFKTTNAAFIGDRGASDSSDESIRAGETARILRDIATLIDEGRTAGEARDINGNTVGAWTLTGR